MRVGSAIVDAYNDRATVGEIGDTRIARQWHGRMRRRDAVEVRNLAVGGIAAVEILAVPRGKTNRLVMRIVLRDVHAAADEIGRSDTVAAATLGHRLAWVDHP